MAIEKKLFVYDAGVRDGTMDYSKNHLYSGIRATIFGASGTANQQHRQPRQAHRC
jgi:hypothetical protein